MCGHSVKSIADLIWASWFYVWRSWLFREILVTKSIVVRFRLIRFLNKTKLLSTSFDTKRLNHPHLWGITKHNDSSLLTGSNVDQTTSWMSISQSNPKASVYWLIHSTLQCIYQWFRDHSTYFLYSNPTLIIYELIEVYHLFIDNSKLYNDISSRL